MVMHSAVLNYVFVISTKPCLTNNFLRHQEDIERQLCATGLQSKKVLIGNRNCIKCPSDSYIFAYLFYAADNARLFFRWAYPAC